MHNENGNGAGRFSFADWERALWDAADVEMHETTLQAVHVKDPQTKSILFRVLTFVKRLRQEVQDAAGAITNLYRHGLRQQREIRELEDAVLYLAGKVEALARRERERSTREAVTALERGEDVEKVLTDLGRPETASVTTEGGDNGEAT